MKWKPFNSHSTIRNNLAHLIHFLEVLSVNDNNPTTPSQQCAITIMFNYFMRYGIITDYSKWNQMLHFIETHFQSASYINTKSEFNFMFYLTDNHDPEDTRLISLNEWLRTIATDDIP
jgi:hypothetical protein